MDFGKLDWKRVSILVIGIVALAAVALLAYASVAPLTPQVTIPPDSSSNLDSSNTTETDPEPQTTVPQDTSDDPEGSTTPEPVVNPRFDLDGPAGTYALNEPMLVDGVEWTVTSVEFAEAYEPLEHQITNPNNGEFIIIHVNAKNISNETIVSNVVTNLYVKNKTNESFRVNWDAMTGPEDLLLTQIPAGVTVSGFVVFDVSISSGSWKLFVDENDEQFILLRAS